MKSGSPVKRRRGDAAFTIVEVVVSAALIGISSVSLITALSMGFAMVRANRENLRATQIMVQKVETLRLYNWGQLLDTTNYLVPHFSEYFNPDLSNGVLYNGTVTLSLPTNLPPAYTNNIRIVTVSVSWTNYVRAQPIAHTRQMQTYAAEYGIQNYVYNP